MASEARSRNIYIVGAQCTGKTTLVDALESKLTQTSETEGVLHTWKPTVVREVARTVLREKQFTREDIKLGSPRNLLLQQHILDAQLNAEQAVSAHSTPSKWYISDRSGLDPIVYARFFGGEDAAANMFATEAWIELEGRMKGGIVVLCEAGANWLKDDGTRLMPTGLEEWTGIDATFRDLLAARQISYTVLSKDVVSLAERVKFVMDQM